MQLLFFFFTVSVHSADTCKAACLCRSLSMVLRHSNPASTFLSTTLCIAEPKIRAVKAMKTKICKKKEEGSPTFFKSNLNPYYETQWRRESLILLDHLKQINVWIQNQHFLFLEPECVCTSRLCVVCHLYVYKCQKGICQRTHLCSSVAPLAVMPPLTLRERFRRLRHPSRRHV